MKTTPCFIRKSSPEIIERLKQFGYAIMYGYKIEGIEIYTCNFGVAFIPVGADIPEIPVDKIEDFDTYIDCGENEDLFLAKYLTEPDYVLAGNPICFSENLHLVLSFRFCMLFWNRKNRPLKGHL